jgi:hypothetical protein
MLLLNETKQCHRVTYNSTDWGGVFQVHTNDGIVNFKPSTWELHYHDVSNAESNIKLMLVNTVRENLEGYTCHKVKKAREARHIQGMIANPIKKEIAGMVREQLLTNFPVTVQDIDIANRFLCHDLANPGGKTTRTKP